MRMSDTSSSTNGSDTSTCRLRHVNGRRRPVPMLNEPITIGRHPDNTIRVKDDRISRYHCVIEPNEAGVWEFRDLGSRNGSKVNGKRCEQAELCFGDLIRLGSQDFVVEEVKPGEHKEDVQEEDQMPRWMMEMVSVIKSASGTEPAAMTLRLIDAGGKSTEALAGDGDGARATKLLLLVASSTHATDIHIEPKASHHTVRIRVDGQMVWVTDLPTKAGKRVTNLVRTACNSSDTSRDAIIDGRFSVSFKQGMQSRGRVDYRVSLTPSVNGSKMVLRVLDMGNVPRSIEEIGMPTFMLDRVRRVCEQDTGLLLVTGPTGSGKTTTLYNAVREVDREVRNVVTIEDPVEYELEGVTQMPIDDARGNTFHALLRSVLRQDPDVILVGEVRDPETAKVAMQASMTGHLVFSTLHAKDTISSVFRLLDLGLEPYLVANSLQLVLAQRLVRVLCDRCKRIEGVTPAEATRMGRHLGGKTEICSATGCPACLRTGYAGRRAIFELLDFNDQLRDVILENPTISAMRKIIDQGVFTTLEQSGWKLVADGATTMSEIDRVAGSA
jgi:general secretion pathway protein E